MTHSTPKTLEARVAAANFECPQHPRVEPLSLGSLLKDLPSAALCLDAGATVCAALKLLAEHGRDALLVLEGGRLIGIFSEHDFARAAARLGAGALERPLGDAMAPCPDTVTPNESVPHCLHLMREKGLRHLPVLAPGEPPALLALDDLLRRTLDHYDKVFQAQALDAQLLFLPGTYSC